MQSATITLEDLIHDGLQLKPTVRIPATTDDYFDLLQDNELYDIEYFNHEITVHMSSASDEHELLVATLIRLLGNKYYDTNYRVYGSNRPVYIKEMQAGYNADVMVLKGPTQLFPREKAIAATLNPYLLIEVLSESNKSKDFIQKIENYKKIESLEYLITVNQYSPKFSVFIRNQNNWEEKKYKTIEENVMIGDLELPMKEMYRNLFD